MTIRKDNKSLLRINELIKNLLKESDTRGVSMAIHAMTLNRSLKFFNKYRERAAEIEKQTGSNQYKHIISRIDPLIQEARIYFAVAKISILFRLSLLEQLQKTAGGSLTEKNIISAFNKLLGDNKQQEPEEEIASDQPPEAEVEEFGDDASDIDDDLSPLQENTNDEESLYNKNIEDNKIKPESFVQLINNLSTIITQKDVKAPAFFNSVFQASGDISIFLESTLLLAGRSEINPQQFGTLMLKTINSLQEIRTQLSAKGSSILSTELSQLLDQIEHLTPEERSTLAKKLKTKSPEEASQVAKDLMFLDPNSLFVGLISAYSDQPVEFSIENIPKILTHHDFPDSQIKLLEEFSEHLLVIKKAKQIKNFGDNLRSEQASWDEFIDAVKAEYPLALEKDWENYSWNSRIEFDSENMDKADWASEIERRFGKSDEPEESSSYLSADRVGRLIGLLSQMKREKIISEDIEKVRPYLYDLADTSQGSNFHGIHNWINKFKSHDSRESADIFWMKMWEVLSAVDLSKAKELIQFFNKYEEQLLSAWDLKLTPQTPSPPEPNKEENPTTTEFHDYVMNIWRVGGFPNKDWDEEEASENINIFINFIDKFVKEKNQLQEKAQGRIVTHDWILKSQEHIKSVGVTEQEQQILQKNWKAANQKTKKAVRAIWTVIDTETFKMLWEPLNNAAQVDKKDQDSRDDLETSNSEKEKPDEELSAPKSKAKNVKDVILAASAAGDLSKEDTKKIADRVQDEVEIKQKEQPDLSEEEAELEVISSKKFQDWLQSDKIEHDFDLDLDHLDDESEEVPLSKAQKNWITWARENLEGHAAGKYEPLPEYQHDVYEWMQEHVDEFGDNWTRGIDPSIVSVVSNYLKHYRGTNRDYEADNNNDAKNESLNKTAKLLKEVITNTIRGQYGQKKLYN